MAIKCIALDLDGTTLDQDGRLPEANRKAMEDAITQGIEIVIASGRAYDTLPQEVLSIKGIGWAILPRCLLLGRSIYKNAVVEIKPPFALEPERLVLRYRAGEVSTEILDWWEKKIIHYRRTIGLTDSPASKPD